MCSCKRAPTLLVNHYNSVIYEPNIRFVDLQGFTHFLHREKLRGLWLIFNCFRKWNGVSTSCYI